MAQPIGLTPHKEKRMPSKDSKVIGIKVSEKEFQMIETYANTHNISVSALFKLFMNDLLNGNIELEKGELKTGVNPNGYAICEEIDTPFGQKVDRKFDRLRERGYPENFIYSMKEQILNGIDSQIDMLPKKFDARRMRDSDIGC